MVFPINTDQVMKLKSLFVFTISFWLSIIYSVGNEPFSWPLKELDTARDTNWLSHEEKDMILEINMLRYNPAQYALQYIEWMRLFYIDKTLELPNNPDIIHTEGIESFNNMITYLHELSPMPVLIPSRGMTKAVRMLVYDQSLTGKTGHISSGNRKPETRLSTFGNWYGSSGEIAFYGKSDPRTMVILMLFDNNHKEKNRRETLLNPAYQYIGLSIGHHKVQKQMCAISFCTKYIDK